jgi:hypothetical protein
MKNTWSTTITDWQGVDSAAKPYSKNLVDGGAISVIETVLHRNIGGSNFRYFFKEDCTVLGKSIDYTTGEYANSNVYDSSDYIEITSDIILSTSLSSLTAGLAFYSDRNESSYISGINYSGQNEVVIEKPGAARYIRFCARKINDPNFYIGFSSTMVGNIFAAIGYFECSTPGNTALKSVYASGYLMPVGGSIKIKMVNKNTANNATMQIYGNEIKPLYYNGIRVSSSNSWEANEIIEVFYDGTNYQSYSVAGKNRGDGVFDISTYNLTNDYPTPYSDLESALGANGVNVPASYRKGGMSVKFIQSSSNKYIQARLMANEFTTDVTKWQGVDDEPTAGSDNLVKSGGIKSKIEDAIIRPYLEYGTSVNCKDYDTIKITHFIEDIKMTLNRESGYNYCIGQIGFDAHLGGSATGSYYITICKYPSNKEPSSSNMILIKAKTVNAKPNNGLFVIDDTAILKLNWDVFN